jgi:hypothetical protein
MILRKRIQAQSLTGNVDRIVSVIVPPTGAYDAKLLRSTWLTAKVKDQGERSLEVLQELVSVLVLTHKTKLFLKRLDEFKGRSILDLLVKLRAEIR